MIYQRDIATKCKFLLGQWKDNLNLTNYERTKLEDTLNPVSYTHLTLPTILRV